MTFLDHFSDPFDCVGWVTRLIGFAAFLVTLERKQKGDHPSPEEIRATYTDMLNSCSTDDCRSHAKEISDASMQVYEINREWAKAGCKGRLDD